MAGKNTNSISDWYKRKGLSIVLKGLSTHGCLIHYVYNANYASLFAVVLAKLLVNGNITGSCHTNMSPKHEIKRYKQQKWTLQKNCQANKFEKTTTAIRFNLLQFFHSWLLVFAVFFTSSLNFWSSYVYVWPSSVAARTVWFLTNFVTHLL